MGFRFPAHLFLVALLCTILFGLAPTHLNLSSLIKVTSPAVKVQSLNRVIMSVSPYYPVADLGEQYYTDWFGNTFPATEILPNNNNKIWNRKYVQVGAETIHVDADGRVFTNTYWDERGGNSSVYFEGDLLYKVGQRSPNAGGYAIAGDDKYIYLDSGKSGHWGIARYHKVDGSTASFSGGLGIDGNVLPIRAKGLSLSNDKLFVSTFSNSIKVFDLSDPTRISRTPVFSISITSPGDMAVDSQGYVWIVADSSGRWSINRYSPDGIEDVSRRIYLPQSVVPKGIAIDKDDRLLIADQGIDQNIKVYKNIIQIPQIDEAFGIEGGIFADQSGKFEDKKFHFPVDIGVDAENNLYVAHGSPQGVGTKITQEGVMIESYTPQGELKWRLESHDWQETADFDPANPGSVYSVNSVYRINYDAQPGKGWQYVGTTLDPFAFPDDPRLHTHAMETAWVRRINGQKYLFTASLRDLAVYRFDKANHGEIAIPYALFSSGPLRDPWFEQPERGEWIWKDQDYDGQIDANEFHQKPDSPLTRGGQPEGIQVLADGTVLISTVDTVREFFIGKESNGLPDWNFEASNFQETPIPSEQFDEVRRVLYDETTDRMYLFGFTDDLPFLDPYRKIASDFKQVGRWGIAISNWSQGNRTPDDNFGRRISGEWGIELPWDPTADREQVKAITLAGDYIFAILGSTSKEGSEYRRPIVFVYDKNNGQMVGTMQPGGNIGDRAMVDKPYAINARQLPDGEYVVFAMDNAYNKIIMYRWNPESASSSSTNQTILEGTSEGDMLVGQSANNRLAGEAGDDTLHGNGGDDKLRGGLGADKIFGGDGDDFILGGAGDDVLIGESGNDYLRGGSGIDILEGGRNDDRLIGGSNNDDLYGGSGNDRMFGNGGDDFLAGNGGNDYIAGQFGDDMLRGNAGDDTLNGGQGDDQVAGGEGSDSFFLNGPGNGIDVIQDFFHREDNLIINLAEFDLNLSPGTLPEPRFTMGATASNRVHRFIFRRYTGELFFDSDGTGSAEQVLVATLLDRPYLNHESIILA